MTYDEIKTKVAEYLNRTDLTSQMDMFIDLTESDINKVIKHQDLIKRANAVAETQYTQLPSDWSRVINVELNTSDHTLYYNNHRVFRFKKNFYRQCIWKTRIFCNYR